MSRPLTTALRLAKVLDGAAIPHALMGGLATQLLAVPTPTYDVDVTIDSDLLVASPSIDRAYLETWAKRLDVTARLKESLDEADAFWRSPGP